MRPPPVPAAELRPRGKRHSIRRDARAVRHHYDLPPEFFALFLGEELTYSCALFTRGATTLEEAQEQKLDMVCRKLDLEPGSARARRGLRLGQLRDPRGRAPRRARARASPSPSRRRPWRSGACRERGLADRVEIRVADYRELQDDPFDAVASIGMVEHVGSSQIDVYARAAGPRAPARRPAAQPRDRAHAHGRPGGRARSPSATSSPTAPRSTSRASSWRSSAPAS